MGSAGWAQQDGLSRMGSAGWAQQDGLRYGREWADYQTWRRGGGRSVKTSLVLTGASLFTRAKTFADDLVRYESPQSS
uniref:Uncharacterized protein n=1 Tax=Melanopsichium pennsylvanicum 4 TaxID=1398559 RepID=A0A077R8D3_9BASI|nr:uncharacterized protein BN887_06203 [Melanopsichium pennsylvanicum 4]